MTGSSQFRCRLLTANIRFGPGALARRFRLLVVLSFVAALVMAPLPASAGVLSYLDPSYFQVINTNADGSAVSLNNDQSLEITGGNNGSGLPGTTDVVFIPFFVGIVSFDWAYSSLDTPTFDNAGLLTDSIYTQLADTDGETGSTAVTLSGSQVFGFRVATMDNTGEPGVITISAFNAVAVSAPVPEPGTMALLVPLALAAIAAGMRARRVQSL